MLNEFLYAIFLKNNPRNMQTGFFANPQLLYNKIALLEKRTSTITVTHNQLITKNITITLPIFTNKKFTLPIKNFKEIINSTFEMQAIDEKTTVLNYTISNYNIRKSIKFDNNHMKPINITSLKRVNIDNKLAKLLWSFDDCEKLHIKYEDNLFLYVNGVIKFECRIDCNFPFTNFKIMLKDLWFLKYDWKEIVMCIDEVVYFYLYDDETTVVIKINKVT